MLETLSILLLVLWFLGVVSSVVVGGMIHLLLTAVVVMTMVRLGTDSRPLH
jgi:hypothetical protein